MSDDLISRQAAIECLEMFLDKQCDRERTKARGFSDNDIWASVNMAYNALSAERVGKWIEVTNKWGGLEIRCSECGAQVPRDAWGDAMQTSYCYRCGAMMDEVTE